MLWYKVVECSKVLKDVRVVDVGGKPVPFREMRQREAESYEKGKTDAENACSAKIVDIQESMDKMQSDLFSKISSEFEKLKSSINDNLPALVVSVCEKVLPNVNLENKDLEAIIKSVLNDVDYLSGDVELRLCEDDVVALSKSKGNFLDTIDSSIKFMKDTSLSSGDVLIKTKFGMVDGRISSKLNKIEKQLAAI